MVRFKCIPPLALLTLAGLAPAAAQGVDYFRQQGQLTCMSDVMSLCAAYVPDETQIIACMQQHRGQLSAPCRQVFDAGVKAQRQHTRRQSRSE